ncbi:uncharacterized protein [Osmerus mordax]|uniref:uncharacterized protein n=1 Tax=Osmerus mordax TaxID=8014 RepID=UPI00351019CF
MSVIQSGSQLSISMEAQPDPVPEPLLLNDSPAVPGACAPSLDLPLPSVITTSPSASLPLKLHIDEEACSSHSSVSTSEPLTASSRSILSSQIHTKITGKSTESGVSSVTVLTSHTETLTVLSSTSGPVTLEAQGLQVASEDPSPLADHKTCYLVPVTKAPSPVPVAKTPSPVPVTKTPSPVPVTKTPSPVADHKTSSPVPVTKTPSPVPVTKTPSPVARSPILVAKSHSPVTVTTKPSPVSIASKKSPCSSPVPIPIVLSASRAAGAPSSVAYTDVSEHHSVQDLGITLPCCEPLLEDALDKLLALHTTKPEGLGERAKEKQKPDKDELAPSPVLNRGHAMSGEEQRTWREEEEGIYPGQSTPLSGREGTLTPLTEASWMDDSLATPCTCPGTPDGTLDVPLLQPSAVERLSTSGQRKAVTHKNNRHNILACPAFCDG